MILRLLGTLSRRAEHKAQKIITLLCLAEVAYMLVSLHPISSNLESKVVLNMFKSESELLIPSKTQLLLVHHMAAILCQQHCTIVFQKKKEEKVLCLKLKRDLSHKSMPHIITQTGTNAGPQYSSVMGTLTAKGQRFDLMSKWNASYSLHSAIRQTIQFCWETINLMLWKQNIKLWSSIILGAFDPGLSWSSSPDNLCAWSFLVDNGKFCSISSGTSCSLVTAYQLKALLENQRNVTQHMYKPGSFIHI